MLLLELFSVGHSPSGVGHFLALGLNVTFPNTRHRKVDAITPTSEIVAVRSYTPMECDPTHLSSDEFVMGTMNSLKAPDCERGSPVLSDGLVEQETSPSSGFAQVLNPTILDSLRREADVVLPGHEIRDEVDIPQNLGRLIHTRPLHRFTAVPRACP